MYFSSDSFDLSSPLCLTVNGLDTIGNVIPTEVGHTESLTHEPYSFDKSIYIGTGPVGISAINEIQIQVFSIAF